MRALFSIMLRRAKHVAELLESKRGDMGSFAREARQVAPKMRGLVVVASVVLVLVMVHDKRWIVHVLGRKAIHGVDRRWI